jgi:hypothetical protein
MKFLPVALFNDEYRRSPLLDHQVIRLTAELAMWLAGVSLKSANTRRKRMSA